MHHWREAGTVPIEFQEGLYGSNSTLLFHFGCLWSSPWIMHTFSFSFFAVLRPKKGIMKKEQGLASEGPVTSPVMCVSVCL